MLVLASISWAAGIAGTFIGLLLAASGLILNARRDARRDNAEQDDRAAGRRDVARDEAVVLATVRGEEVGDLRRELGDLKEQYSRERDDQIATITNLQRTIDLIREQAFETLQVYAHGQRALFVTILGDLEREPPNVARAVSRIHHILSDPNPQFPGHTGL